MNIIYGNIFQKMAFKTVIYNFYIIQIKDYFLGNTDPMNNAQTHSIR